MAEQMEFGTWKLRAAAGFRFRAAGRGSRLIDVMEAPILVTGGAGYIGSHTVRLLAAQGRKVVVLDNLVYGHRDAIVDPGVELVVGEVGDTDWCPRCSRSTGSGR